MGGLGSAQSEDKANGKADDEMNNVDKEKGGNESGTVAGTTNKRRRHRESDPNHKMSGQLSSEAPSLEYQGKNAAGIAHIKTLVSREVIKKHKIKSMK
jgi:hypothetical protein